MGEERSEHVENIALAWSIALVEVTLRPDEGPFGEDEEFDWQCGDKGSRLRICKHVAEIFLRQHRECFYMALVTGTRTRLTRWDRCGVVVSSAFDWIANVDLLVNFFYKIATSSRAMQDFDTSISLATDDEKAELERYRDGLRARGDRHRLQFVETMMENECIYPIYRVSTSLYPDFGPYLLLAVFQLNCEATIDGPASSFAHAVYGKTLTLLIGQYHAHSYSLSGRGTKGYFAYVVGEGQLVFLKLSWRSSSSDVDPEHKTYERIYAEHVEQIPQLITGEDVRHVDDKGPGRRLCTQTQEFLPSVKPFGHYAYRLVIETLGVPLAEYRDTWIMFRIVAHAFIGAPSHSSQADASRSL